MCENGRGGIRQQRFLDVFERRFAEKTNCHQIEATKYYFLQKTGKGTVPFVYEFLAWQNLAELLKKSLDKGELPKRQVFTDYSYRRYGMYFGNLNKAFLDCFLEKGNFLDGFVRTCPGWFVQEYLELLVAFRDGRQKQLSEDRKKALLEKLLLVYSCIMQEDYTEEKADYGLVFQYRLQIPSLLEFVRESLCRTNLKIQPKQVNYYNYGYYFFLLQSNLAMEKTVRERAGRQAEFWKTHGANRKPVLLDVWGSCISRIPVNFNEKELAANVYLFQVGPFGVYEEPQEYDPGLLSGNDPWRDSLFDIQFRHGMREVLAESGAEWMIADLYAVSCLSLYEYQRNLYVLGKETARKLRAKKINICLNKEDRDFITKEIMAWAGYIKQRYGKKIILVKNRRSEAFIRADGNIAWFGSWQENAERNKFTTELNEMLFRELDCYYIDLVDEFLSDELSYLELRPTHYENELYEEEGKIIEHIVKEHPLQKHYTTYGNRVRISRICKLLEKNRGSAVLRELFHGKALDSLVLNMEISDIRQYQELLLELYDQDFANQVQIFHYLKEMKKYHPFYELMIRTMLQGTDG